MVHGPSSQFSIKDTFTQAAQFFGIQVGSLGKTNKVSTTGGEKSDQSQKSTEIMGKTSPLLDGVKPDISEVKKDFWTKSKGAGGENVNVSKEHKGTTLTEMKKEKGKASGEHVNQTITKTFREGWEAIKDGFKAFGQGQQPKTQPKKAASTETRKPLSSEDQKVLGEVLEMMKTDPRKAGAKLGETDEKGNRSVKDLDQVLEKITEKINDPHVLAEMILGATSEEIKKQFEPGNPLRGNTASSKLLKIFTDKFLAPKFAANQQFQSLVNNLPQENLRKRLENPITDPKTGRSENYEITNVQRDQTEQFLRKILLVTNNVLENHKEDPAFQAFHKICQESGQLVDEKLGNVKETGTFTTGEIVAGGFLFLRFLNPIITDPKSGGIEPLPRSPEQRDNATVLTKIVLNLANRLEFKEKEGYMTAFNSFLKEEGIPGMDTIRNRLVGE